MSIIREWAYQFAIPFEALFELERRLGVAAAEINALRNTAEADAPHGSESRQQSLVMLEAAQKNISLMRNNVGALMDKRGIPVRYGLMNTSHDLNDVVKSGDLIGIEPKVITLDDVGTTIGRFLSVEMKHEGWVYNPNDAHEVAQYRWAKYVIRYGGRAIFATGPGML